MGTLTGGTIGERVLRLNVADGNATACAPYKRHGFVRTGELGDLMEDGMRREHVMEKAVALHV